MFKPTQLTGKQFDEGDRVEAFIKLPDHNDILRVNRVVGTVVGMTNGALVCVKLDEPIEQDDGYLRRIFVEFEDCKRLSDKT